MRRSNDVTQSMFMLGLFQLNVTLTLPAQVSFFVKHFLFLFRLPVNKIFPGKTTFTQFNPFISFPAYICSFLVDNCVFCQNTRRLTRRGQLANSASASQTYRKHSLPLPYFKAYVRKVKVKSCIQSKSHCLDGKVHVLLYRSAVLV